MGYTWDVYDASVLKILRNSQVISVAWKELHSEDISVKCLADYKGYKAGELNDRALIEEVWKVLDEADVVVAHHGIAFDIKKLNARFVYYGLNAPSHYDVVDTKKEATKRFRFDGNSLNALGQYLNVGKKLENGGFDLWLRCMAGDKEAWKLMKNYNSQDVLLLEQVYLKLRPFMERHPNLSLVAGDDPVGTCGTCQSKNVSRRGYAVTKTGRKQRLQCQDCGSWSTGSFERNKKVTTEELLDV